MEIAFTQKTQKNIIVNTVTINAVIRMIMVYICLPVNIQSVSVEIKWK